ncbi:MAG: hypothetical protein ACFB9M_10640 [Myxococcota bacterium]
MRQRIAMHMAGLVLAIGGCGDGVADLGPTSERLRVEVEGSEGGTSPCFAFPQITRLSAVARRVLGPGPSGVDVETRALASSCEDSSVSLSNLPPGRYEVMAEGLGSLQGRVDQVLYRGITEARLPMDAPEAASILVLRPVVAFLTVEWAVEDGIDACAVGADAVSVSVVSTEQAGDEVEEIVACDRSGLTFLEPLLPGSYRIDVSALGPTREEPVRFRTETRILNAGQNRVSLRLEPPESRIRVDWSFVRLDQATRGCDVHGVTEVSVRAETPSARIDQVYACALARPANLPPVFRPGERVDVHGRAEGREDLFLASASIVMPANDVDIRLDLEAHGRLLLAWQFAPECLVSEEDRVAISAVGDQSAWMVDVPAVVTSTLTPEFPYGAYGLEWTLMEASWPRCRADTDVELFELETFLQVTLTSTRT